MVIGSDVVIQIMNSWLLLAIVERSSLIELMTWDKMKDNLKRLLLFLVSRQVRMS